MKEAILKLCAIGVFVGAFLLMPERAAAACCSLGCCDCSCVAVTQQQLTALPGFLDKFAKLAKDEGFDPATVQLFFGGKVPAGTPMAGKCEPCCFPQAVEKPGSEKLKLEQLGSKKPDYKPANQNVCGICCTF